MNEYTYIETDIYSDEKINPIAELELFEIWIEKYIGGEKIEITKEERSSLFRDFQRELKI